MPWRKGSRAAGSDRNGRFGKGVVELEAKRARPLRCSANDHSGPREKRSEGTRHEVSKRRAKNTSSCGRREAELADNASSSARPRAEAGQSVRTPSTVKQPTKSTAKPPSRTAPLSTSWSSSSRARTLFAKRPARAWSSGRRGQKAWSNDSRRRWKSAASQHRPTETA